MPNVLVSDTCPTQQGYCEIACLDAHAVPDPDTPMEEIVRAFNWCIDKGMALYWATSEWPAHLVVEAHAVANKLLLIPPITEV